MHRQATRPHTGSCTYTSKPTSSSIAFTTVIIIVTLIAFLILLPQVDDLGTGEGPSVGSEVGLEVGLKVGLFVILDDEFAMVVGLEVGTEVGRLVGSDASDSQISGQSSQVSPTPLQSASWLTLVRTTEKHHSPTSQPSPDVTEPWGT